MRVRVPPSAPSFFSKCQQIPQRRLEQKDYEALITLIIAIWQGADTMPAAGPMVVKKRSSLRHKLFQSGIILKGIDSVLEIIGAFLILMISPQFLNKIVYLLTQHELSEDPKDIVANYLIHAANHFSVSSQLFGFIYLLSHGMIKIILIVSLWQQRLWSYPVAMIFFALFGVYQLFKYHLEHSPGWVVLTILDVFIIVLTWMEYRQLRGVYPSS